MEDTGSGRRAPSRQGPVSGLIMAEQHFPAPSIQIETPRSLYLSMFNATLFLTSAPPNAVYMPLASSPTPY